MTVQFPGCGELKYNGFEFPATFQLKLNATAIYADQTAELKYFSNVLNVSFIISQEMVPDDFPSVTYGTDLDTVDNYVAAIRQTLQEPRKDLYIKYQGLGFKEVVISPGTTDGISNDYIQVSDVASGPLPRTFNIEPIGSNRACRITWSVEFFTLRCLHDLEDTYLPPLVSFTRDIRYGLNDRGLSQITISGTAEFAHKVTSKSDVNTIGRTGIQELLWATPTILDGTDDLLTNNFVIAKSEYFARKDGRTIDYMIVYEERDSLNNLFPYSVKVDATHRMGSSLNNDGQLTGKGFFSWDNTISAKITIGTGYSQALAYAVFLWILSQRFGRIGTDRLVNPESSIEQYDDAGKKTKPNNVLTSLEIEENIYSRTHTFKATYLGIYKLSRLFYQSGLFQSIRTVKDDSGKYPWEAGYTIDPKTINSTERKFWYKTIYDSFYPPTGRKEIGQYKKSVLFDPCPDEATYNPFAATTNEFDVNIAYTDPLCEPKTDEDSYVAYEVDFELIENTGNYQIRIQTSGPDEESYKSTNEEELTVNRASSPEGDKLFLAGKSGSGALEATAVNSYSGGSTYALVVRGYGVRYQKEVPVPAVVGVLAGEQYVPVERMGSPRILRKKLSPGSCSLFYTAWVLTYSVPYQLSGPIRLFDGDNNEIETGGRFILPPETTA